MQPNALLLTVFNDEQVIATGLLVIIKIRRKGINVNQLRLHQTGMPEEDQIWTEYRDDQYFEKPLLRHLPEIARNLIALDEQSAALKNAAIFNTTGEHENAGKLIRNVIENLVKRDRLERAALPYNQRQKQD